MTVTATTFKHLLFAGAASLAAASTWAGSCAEHYAGGIAPVITNKAMAQHASQLCFDEISVMHSGITRTPLWSAEKLTKNSLSNAKAMVRQNAFHPESQLPKSERAELRDYQRSGYDRGHMAPSGDMPSPEAQMQSFSLANIIPQNPNNNRNLWEGIESAVRTLAIQRGTLYVITGPLFEGDSLLRLNDRVMVPTSLYKVVYDPQRQQAAAYVVKNEATKDYKVVSISALESRAGLNLLPGVPASVKSSASSLPSPTPHGYGDHAGKRRASRNSA